MGLQPISMVHLILPICGSVVLTKSPHRIPDMETMSSMVLPCGLGRPRRRNIVLQEQAIELMGIQVVSTRGSTGQNAGTSTQVSADDINSLPTLNRDLNDFTRLTPQASTSVSGISFAGVNNRYNAIYIDGAVNNDVFGLTSSGTNGGSTGISPISIDVIDQIQVVLVSI